MVGLSEMAKTIVVGVLTVVLAVISSDDNIFD